MQERVKMELFLVTENVKYAAIINITVCGFLISRRSTCGSAYHGKIKFALIKKRDTFIV